MIKIVNTDFSKNPHQNGGGRTLVFHYKILISEMRKFDINAPIIDWVIDCKLMAIKL